MTLIELLVSIGIIALLAAVSLPIFSSYQRQNKLNLDAKNLEQLFYYSRTLNNNPSYNSRNSGARNRDAQGNEKRYGVKIALGEKKATLHPINSAGDIDSSKELDSLKFDSRATLELKAAGVLISQDLTIYISGDPPNETVSCSLAGPVQPDCSQVVSIKITLPGVANSKTLSIHGTQPAPGQKFNIQIN